MTVNNQELVSTNCSKNKPDHARRLNWRSINYCLWSGMALSILLYLIIANSLATQTFALRDYKNQLAGLKQDQADLQDQITQLSSYNYLQGQIQSLNMVPVDRLSYAITDQDFLAKK
jgi:cell division protein FtsB